MEPMTLGSPVGSPTGLAAHPFPLGAPASAVASPALSAQQSHAIGAPSPATHAAAAFGAQSAAAAGSQGFLPGYLLGDVSFSQQSSSTPTGGSGRLLSPTKLNRSLSTQQQQQPSTTPQTPRQGGFLTPNSSSIVGSRTPASEKPAGGPPTNSLLYSSFRNRGTPGGAAGTPKTALNATPMPKHPQLSFGATPNSSSAGGVRDEIFNQSAASCQDATNNWVTVFGFPPSAASYILSQFSQFGTILQHHVPPNGNWMHIKYQTKLQAQKALGKTNRVMGGSIMIGVSVCSDPAVLDDNNSSVLNQSNVCSGVAAASTPVHSHQQHLNQSVNQSVTTLNSSLGGNHLNRSTIRPLAQAYKAANTDNDILNRTHTPNKSTGIVSKAMEYIFGW